MNTNPNGTDEGECKVAGCCGTPITCEGCGSREATEIGGEWLCAACAVELNDRSPTAGGDAATQPAGPAAPSGGTFGGPVNGHGGDRRAETHGEGRAPQSVEGELSVPEAGAPFRHVEGANHPSLLHLVTQFVNPPCAHCHDAPRYGMCDLCRDCLAVAEGDVSWYQDPSGWLVEVER